jgi:hypothetical protein
MKCGLWVVMGLASYMQDEQWLRVNTVFTGSWPDLQQPDPRLF